MGELSFLVARAISCFFRLLPARFSMEKEAKTFILYSGT